MIKNIKIAIIGATSHIAKGLIYSFSRKKNTELFLYARSLDSLNNFLYINKFDTSYIKSSNFDKFQDNKYDVVINCIGLGDPAKIGNILRNHFQLTEYFDNLVINYLKENTETLYINMSSAAVFGTDFFKPADYLNKATIPINNITPDIYYSIAKINAEAKHRAFSDFNIVDFRIFTYFSRFIDIESGYLITEIIKAIKGNKIFITDEVNIVRDYIGPDDIYNLICCCIKCKQINSALDIYSAQPVHKFDLLDFIKSKYNLQYSIINNKDLSSATGRKMNYYSTNKIAAEIGYRPVFSSINLIDLELAYILK
jgi:nucleoside-diphosphate-sugar epimerase